ncbi:hypothetical protein MtrunA17_Chr5g0442611 [Medicago truncatula]|uniref:Uncharacterized protein n=1 Tax=Medicago truncatula TaxID=3880 RepID=A0A396I458_MEDTR|nr:hypothetical protein MtrunA17_Chr5g0442611 [Medicago truncatula]
MHLYSFDANLWHIILLTDLLYQLLFVLHNSDSFLILVCQSNLIDYDCISLTSNLIQLQIRLHMG